MSSLLNLFFCLYYLRIIQINASKESKDTIRNHLQTSRPPKYVPSESYIKFSNWVEKHTTFFLIICATTGVLLAAGFAYFLYRVILIIDPGAKQSSQSHSRVAVNNKNATPSSKPKDTQQRLSKDKQNSVSVSNDDHSLHQTNAEETTAKKRRTQEPTQK